MQEPDIPNYNYPHYKVGYYAKMVGTTPNMWNLFRIINGLAEEKGSVVVVGPSGSGKELVAKGIAYHSKHYDGLSIINVPILGKEALESDLFGSEQGAFTGVKTREGKFGAANGKTIFLDEIAELDSGCQAKLLRFLQDGRYTRAGGTKEYKSDVRIVAATNKNLKDEVQRGNFRPDLYYRLWSIGIAVPPLQSHLEDIPFLVEDFQKKYECQYGWQPAELSREALGLLQNHTYPGNVRELENILTKTLFMWRLKSNGKGEVLPEHVILDGLVVNEADMEPPASAKNDFSPLMHDTLSNYLELVEKEQIEMALVRNSWNVSATARYLRVGEKTLFGRIKKFGMQRPNKDSD
jgi:DNA-binding NtrC family response regulator